MIPQTPPAPPLEPVEFNLAGSRFIAHPNGQISGTFKAISAELWECIIGFHRQISINLSAESVSYHRWHEGEGRYHSLIPWQKTTKHGLSVSVNWQDPRNVKLLDAYGEAYGQEFFPACTIHTHVNASAFESGTDAKDEKETAGWHITLGNLISHNEYSLDFRMRLPATKKIQQILNIKSAVKLTWKHLFVADATIEKRIHSCPGVTNWHEFINRVETR